jgi:hypothetical protein
MLYLWFKGLFRIFIGALTVAIIVSCEEENLTELIRDQNTDKQWITYIIPPNQNSSINNGLSTFEDSILSFNVVFDSSCVYTSINPTNQFDWNKVAGFSDCNSLHQTNSLRVGWRYRHTLGIELAAYQYTNGIRSFTIIDTVQILDTAHITLLRLLDYETTVNSRTAKTSRHCPDKPTAYMLFPYFGGNETAQDTVRIHVQWLNR